MAQSPSNYDDDVVRVCEAWNILFGQIKQVGKYIDSQNRYVKRLQANVRNVRREKVELFLKNRNYMAEIKGHRKRKDKLVVERDKLKKVVAEKDEKIENLSTLITILKNIFDERGKEMDGFSQIFTENSNLKQLNELQSRALGSCADLISENSELKNTVEKQLVTVKDVFQLMADNSKLNASVGKQKREIKNLKDQLANSTVQLVGMARDPRLKSTNSDQQQWEINYLKALLHVANQLTENNRKEYERKLAVTNAQMQEMAEKFQSEKSNILFEVGSKIRFLELKLAKTGKEEPNQ